MKLLFGLLWTLSCVAPFVAAAGLDELKAGTDYELIEPPQPTIDPKKIEVKEFFSYACPHCYEFEPYVNSWLKKKPDSVVFVRQPVVFGRPQWANLARIYFTAEALDVLDKVHGEVYKALYEGHKSLDSDQDVAALFAAHGVDRNEFDRTYKSFSVDLKVKQADSVVNSYKKVNSTPTVVVNGKYVVRGSHDRIFEIVDLLVAEEAKRAKK